MKRTLIQKIMLTAQKLDPRKSWGRTCLRTPISKQILLLLFIAGTILLGTVLQSQSNVYAANLQSGESCAWHVVMPGDTLGNIARSYRSSIWTLARANRIANINLIYTGHSLCIPYAAGGAAFAAGNGLQANGAVRWYNYRALGWASHPQVATMMRRAAAQYGLPPRLLMAIAWQESGWNQHVIAHDGGIGIMQLMPGTAQGLNVQTRMLHNPYQAQDNIQLGAIYLHSLMLGFHGNLTRVISAYNEGGWNVAHRGIFNWRYVNNVQSLMNRFN